MAKKLYEESYIEDIAVAIREKNGTDVKYKTSEMGDAIRAISSGSGGATTENSDTIGTFTYDGLIYNFIIGMTWRNLIESDMNNLNGGYVFEENSVGGISIVFSQGGGEVAGIYGVSIDGESSVLVSELIINNQNYLTYNYMEDMWQ